MAEHRTLTGASLHECKGADAASADTVLVANGDGTTTWQKLSSSNIDTSSVFNANKFYLTTSFADISTAEDVLIYVPVNCTLTKVTTILHAAIASVNSVITVSNSNGPTTIGTITISFSGSAAGDIDSLAPSANNTFTTGKYVKLSNDGGSSNTARVNVVLEFTQTS